MKRTTIVAVLLVGIAATPLAAQGRNGRYGDRGQGIPPGHLPPPGQCRVWYDNRPPGQQPRPTSCREAERIASRDRYGRVIYGSDEGRWGQDEGRWGGDDRARDREDDRRRGDGPRAVPRDQYPDSRYPDSERYPYPGTRDGRRNPEGSRYPGTRGSYGDQVPFDNGYRDGYDKGREDARDGDRYDPSRHSRYRSGDRGYDDRYGSKADYREVYRDGFRAGYDEGYRDAGGQSRRGGFNLPWPF